MNELNAPNPAKALVSLVAAKALGDVIAGLDATAERFFEPQLAVMGDTINIPVPPAPLRNIQVVLKHTYTGFFVNDVSELLTSRDKQDFYIGVAAKALAEAMNADLSGHRQILLTRRISLPIAGTGAVGQYAELGDFGMSVVMDYNPRTLAQRFTLHVVYGVGTKI